MRILHVGPFKLGTSNGNYNALWALARAQADAGHDVSIVRVGKAVAPPDQAVADAFGVRLLGFPCPRWRGLWHDDAGVLARILDEVRPELVHLCYVRVPKFYFVSRLLLERHLPYVVSVHGGMNSGEMRRRRNRKLVYWHAIEKFVHAHAAGIHFVSEWERSDYYATLGSPRPADCVIPNIADVPATAPSWRGLARPDSPRLAYFGRYDIWTKGLDLALAMIRALRRYRVDAELHLHGTAGGFAPAVARLLRAYPELSVIDHGYVGGDERLARMAELDLYLQYSRFDVFGMSLVEALGIGLPALVSERSALGPELSRRGAVVEIPMDPSAAAAVVAEALKRPRLLGQISARGRDWVKAECSPAAVVERMDRFYEAALAV